jgi:hypothetical protein
LRYPRIGLALVAFAVLMFGAGCGEDQRPAATPSSPPAGTAGPAPGPIEPAAQTPPTTTRPPQAAPAPVDIAVITALTADSVSWVDGKRVPAETNNVMIVRLSGAAHVHSAPLSPDAKFFLPMDGKGNFGLGDNGAGTIPCTREAMADYVVGNDLVAPRLTFDVHGRVATMAARYHP